jgi:hypothetical protein
MGQGRAKFAMLCREVVRVAVGTFFMLDEDLGWRTELESGWSSSKAMGGNKQ